MPPNSIPSKGALNAEMPVAIQVDRTSNIVVDRGSLAPTKKSSGASWMPVPRETLDAASADPATSSSAVVPSGGLTFAHRPLNLSGIMLGTGSGLSFARERRAMRNTSPTRFEEWLKATNDHALLIEE
ncbi:hypothetical protein BDV93DRAFT_555812 [Ceratobasidium sp. AG-I]|nr:hypothetical protein BDV93DRAFT_555812 [Ceratobasidium sp. AG-I]